MTRPIRYVAVLLAVLMVAGGGVIAVNLTGSDVAAQQQESASVTIEDQPSDGQTVIVDSVTVPGGGFVVIHDESLADGDAVDSVVGVSRYLEAGTHEDVPVTVAPELATASDVEVTAMAHQDTNGNQVFDFVTSEGSADGAYLAGQTTETPGADETGTPDDTETETPDANETETPGINETEAPGASETETPGVTETPEEETSDETETPGEETPGEETPGADQTEAPGANETGSDLQVGGPVVDTAVIDATANQVPATNLTFEDQSSDGTTVTVQQVTLYRGGYVVIHDQSLQEDGDEIGSVIGHSEYLPPGTHEDVQVTLAQPLDVSNESNVTVTAMPHFDTNQNLVFDFVTSLGIEDEPYTENESPVVATASVTEGETMPNGTETPSEETPGEETETPGEGTPGEETETPGEETPGEETETPGEETPGEETPGINEETPETEETTAGT